jgi:hypothetical protein
MVNVISFCLWGNELDYTVGAIRNARLIKTIYPNWEGWFYCADEVAKSVKSEIGKYARVIHMPKHQGVVGTFWRMYPMMESGVDYVIMRDADSRINSREKAAVSEWLSSGKTAHIMRDHPAHIWPIMSGMWGCKNGKIDISKTIESAPKSTYFDDQKYLATDVYNTILFDHIAHDSTGNGRYSFCKEFPSYKPEYGTFVGQRITWEDEEGRE